VQFLIEVVMDLQGMANDVVASAQDKAKGIQGAAASKGADVKNAIPNIGK